MGFMNPFSSESHSSTAQNYTSTNQNAATQGGGIAAAANAQVNVLDANAIKAAFDFATHISDTANQVNAQAVAQSGSAITDALSKAATDSGQVLQQTLLWVALVGGAVLLLMKRKG